jgi:hypothetical protein
LGQHTAELERVVGFDLNTNDQREGNHGS